METARRRLGDLGEDQACSHLERLGHVVLERNWRHSHLEIDIITRDPEGLHFVEVKSRTAPVSAAAFSAKARFSSPISRYLRSESSCRTRAAAAAVSSGFAERSAEIFSFCPAVMQA